MKLKACFTFSLVFLVLFTSCATPETSSMADVGIPDRPTNTAELPTETPVLPTETVEEPAQKPVQPTETASPDMEDEMVETLDPLPPEPRRIEFEAEDGIKLIGSYYPAAVDSAPVIVLHHWARGDKSNWLKVGMVQWLTNRGLPLDDLEMSEEDFTKLYPPMPEGISFAVFIYDFRGFGESELENKWYPDGWRMDAQAAIQTAQTLSGVDPDQVASIGSSIGGDGAVLGCFSGCTGAISLSPGNYLDVNYADGVTELEMMGTPVLCFAAEGDGEAAPTCRNTVGEMYDFIIYPDNAHGNDLLVPGRDPDIGKAIQEFLFGILSME